MGYVDSTTSNGLMQNKTPAIGWRWPTYDRSLCLCECQVQKILKK